MDDIHRIGGAAVENLRLKPGERRLNPPGISVLRSPTPGEAADQIRTAFADVESLVESAAVVGSTGVDKIRAAGFDVIPNPTRRLPNHHRIIHPAGAAGFTDENLRALSDAFTETTGH